MADNEGGKPESGELFGVPYNFERPSISRLLSAHWQPDEGMLVDRPFGVGYTLNLANWRSWVVVAVILGLFWQENSGEFEDEHETEEPVEVVVEED